MTKAHDVRNVRICNITLLLGPQVSHTCELLVFHAMDCFGHHQFLPIASHQINVGVPKMHMDWCCQCRDDQHQWDCDVTILDHC